MVLVRILLAVVAIATFLYAARAPYRKPLDRVASAIASAIVFYVAIFTVWSPTGSLGVPAVLLLIGGGLLALAFRGRRRHQTPRYNLLFPGSVSLLVGIGLLLEADRLARRWPW